MEKKEEKINFDGISGGFDFKAGDITSKNGSITLEDKSDRTTHVTHDIKVRETKVSFL